MTKEEKNLMLRKGVYYLRATVNGVSVRQSLHTGDLEEAVRMRDERLAMLGSGQMSDKVLLQSVERRLSGHSSERIQRRYTHLDADDAGEAAAKIGTF